ncbi:MAG: hypothetical protein SF182_10605 [Deltaproteobacteria bacterium]|nr:hypothetical protein [Deltaproteobacteria bacterium]
MATHRDLMCAVLAIALGTGAAQAQVSSESSASILVFPKIVYDGSRDTLIQIVNGANSEVHAHCWYVNGAPTFPDLPAGPLNPPTWAMVDFPITLTRNQPTSFVASRGRLSAPDDPACNLEWPRTEPLPPIVEANYDCYGAGIDPGIVPPMPLGFTGELRCVETDAAGFPISGNHLTGEVMLVDAASGDATRYGAIGIRGGLDNDGDGALRLGEEYDGCPQALLFGQQTDGSEDPQLGAGSSVENELTLTACSIDYLTQSPQSVTVVFEVTNDLAQRLSTAASLDGWRTVRLRDIDTIFSAGVLGAPVAQTRVDAAHQSMSGILGVVEEVHDAGAGRVSAAATNLHMAGTRTAVDLITLP